MQPQHKADSPRPFPSPSPGAWIFSMLQHLGQRIAFTPGIFVKSNNKHGLKFFVLPKLHELKRISIENFISCVAALISPFRVLAFPWSPAVYI